MKVHRIRALLLKELADIQRNRAALMPVAITAFVCLVMPFVVTLGPLFIVGEPLSDDPSLYNLITLRPDLRSIGERHGPETAMQVFFFQQFLLLLLLIPVSGSMAFAAYSVVGEKQSRTLEPLLATPLTTVELLTAKTIAALAPSIGIMGVTAVLYFAGIALLARPGALDAMLNPRTVLLLTGLGPLASLVALQLAVITSSRVNDARTAQQIGVLIILPIVGIMVAQFSGVFVLTVPLQLATCLALIGIAVVLAAIGVAVFDREAILTRLD